MGDLRCIEGGEAVDAGPISRFGLCERGLERNDAGRGGID